MLTDSCINLKILFTRIFTAVSGGAKWVSPQCPQKTLTLPNTDNFFGCLAPRNDPEDGVQILTEEMLISSHRTLRQVNCRLVAR